MSRHDTVRFVHLWVPRRDEHALAASLGLCEPVFEDVTSRVTQEQDRAGRAPDTAVVINRWHLWRVVRALHRTGSTNTREGLAKAAEFLAKNAKQEHEITEDF